MSEIKSYLGWKVDYLNPPGEPAFAGPDSVSWQVFKNPIALAIGGVAAVLLEFADARIRSGVWDHSVFKTDPIGRSKRTVVCPHESGPLFELVPASDMELRHGQEINA